MAWHTKDVRILLFLNIIAWIGFYYFVGMPYQDPVKLQVSMNGCQEDLWKELDYIQDGLSSLAADDPRFLRYIRYRYLTPPSRKQYNFKGIWGNEVYKISTPFSFWVRNFFQNKTNGTFIEVGANEGEMESHTLELEKDLGWSGILIECNPTVVPYLRSKYRKAWVAGVCLSTNERFNVFNFSNPEKWTYSGRLGKAWDLPVKTNWTYFDVESVPLYSIIAAAGYKQIDYLSIDIEGAELEVLKNFPFDKINIKVIIVEIYFLNPEQRIELSNILKRQGYSLANQFSIDWVFVHESANA